MDLLESLYQELVTNWPGKEVAPVVPSAKAVLPAITFRLASEPVDRTVDSTSSLTRALYELTTWSQDLKEAIDLAKELENHFHDKNNYMLGGPTGIKVFHVAKRDRSWDIQPDTEPFVYVVITAFEFKHK